ncbi:MAG: hypothetical protein JWM78_3315 [Verrucomicrobiaceae bacterium]|nr:hypothetical protein [Verrucomicrobiaceae bacterium]
MQNRKKLYRMLAASPLVLLAGLVLAPNVVTAGFHAASKKTPEANIEVAQEASADHPAQKTTRKAHGTSATPLPVITQPADTQSPASPQTEEHGQHDFSGPTTFAINDLAPPVIAENPFPHSASPLFASFGSTSSGRTSKVILKPVTPAPATGDKQADAPATTATTDAAKTNTETVASNDTAVPAVTVAPSSLPGTPPLEVVADKSAKVGDTPTAPTTTSNKQEARPVASVPEPSSIILLTAGLIGLAVARRRAA